MKNIIYTITRNSTNKTVYATDNYKDYVSYVMKHFPKNSYEYNDELQSIQLKYKNFNFSMLVMNKDYIIE